MNAITPLDEQIEWYCRLGPYCDTCGSIPCIYPSFCEACRAADLRLGYKAPSVAADLKSFAIRADELAKQWSQGSIRKADAVDKAFNFALALGLHYRLAKNAGEFMQDKPVLIIQRVLAAAFARPAVVP
jgi:hypothetical protein